MSGSTRKWRDNIIEIPIVCFLLTMKCNHLSTGQTDAMSTHKPYRYQDRLNKKKISKI